MHAIALRGIIAYSRQQSLPPSRVGESYGWLRSLHAIADASARADDFIQAAQMELLPDQVFCFTPKGDVIPLPRGSTPLDFAYAIHSALGNRCSSARVNGRLQSIHSNLRNGDRVEVETSDRARPVASWESLVVSGKARAVSYTHLTLPTICSV